MYIVDQPTNKMFTCDVVVCCCLYISLYHKRLFECTNITSSSFIMSCDDHVWSHVIFCL